MSTVGWRQDSWRSEWVDYFVVGPEIHHVQFPNRRQHSPAGIDNTFIKQTCKTFGHDSKDSTICNLHILL